MQKNVYKNLLFPLFVCTFWLMQLQNSEAACNWKSRYPYMNSWDTCKGSGSINSINSYISFQYKGSTCFKYEWKVNGVYAGKSNTMNYRITQNGTYQICVKVTDTCNRCDTTFCLSKTISCFSKACNWKTRNPKLETWDSCKGSYSNINGAMAFNYTGKSCFKYSWKVNGIKVGEGYKISYPIKQNGTYNLCVTVLDTCNKCDTTFCASRTVSCLPAACNWKARNPYIYSWDTCKGNGAINSLNAYISFQSNLSGCFKYVWKVNGNYAGTSNKLNYRITKNGTYQICVSALDTCNKCDTTFCLSKTITCFGNSCNWKSRDPRLESWDSCKGSNSNINGVMAFNYTGKSCFRYSWKVNGIKVGEGYKISYPVKQNGTYNLCVTVLDTCNNCDTTFCVSRNITCIPSSCNWKSRYPRVETWDSCKGTGSSLNALIAFNYSGKSCFKYTWKVNGIILKTSSKNTLNYPLKQNGKYEICVKVTDTCNKCDTVFCMVKTISCFKNCNWKGKIKAYGLGDTCKKGGAALMGYVLLDSTVNKTCIAYSWMINGAVISKTSRLEYKLLKNGTYKVCLKITDSCNSCDTSICFSKTINCTYLDLNSLYANDALQAYPVPATGLLNIDNPGTDRAVYMVSADGRKIWSGTLIQGVNTVDVSQWPAGIYLLIENSGTAGKPIKIVIE